MKKSRINLPVCDHNHPKNQLKVGAFPLNTAVFTNVVETAVFLCQKSDYAIR